MEIYQKQSIRLRGKAYQKLVVEVFERDVYFCRICSEIASFGPDDEVYGITAHHIIPKGRIRLDMLDNLLTVCLFCHDSIHKNLNDLSVDGIIEEYGQEVTEHLKQG